MSVTVDVPGGTATLRSDRSELTQRRLRPIELVAARVGGDTVQRLQTAARIWCDGDLIDDRSGQKDDAGDLVFTGEDVHLTERQLELLSRMGDAVAWSLLESWTLDRALPDTPDGLLDLPSDLYQALVSETAKLNAKIGTGGFDLDEAMAGADTPEGVDTTLPTGA